MVSLLLLTFWKPLYFWGSLGKWGAEVISPHCEVNAKAGRVDTWGINRSRSPEERMRIEEAEPKLPQAVWRHWAGMLVKKAYCLCLTLNEREKDGDSSVHCSHGFHCSGPCQSQLYCSGPCQSWLHCSGPCQSCEDLVFMSSQTCGLQRKSNAPKSMPKGSMRKETTLSPQFSDFRKWGATCHSSIRKTNLWGDRPLAGFS